MKTLILFFSLLWVTVLSSAEPLAVYLTWTKSPETTMTIQWITDKNEEQDSVEFQKAGAMPWVSSQGVHQPLPQDIPYLIHSVELSDLDPDTDYQFRIGIDGSENAKLYRFRTMPKNLDHPVTFVVGGDTNQLGLKTFAETNKLAASQEPAFALLGGDLAYAASSHAHEPENSDRWLQWIATYSNTMVTPKGYLIPLIVTIGNHDVCGDSHQTPNEAQFFYALFAMPGLPGYNTLRFGDYMGLYLLDSGHTNPIAGIQSDWLADQLSHDQDIPHRFAIYHVPAFPSVREFRSTTSSTIRKNWVPLFEQYGLHIAFENHDHAYKRTYPLRAGQVDPTGIVYIGDGSWGVEPRVPKKPKRIAYLAKSKAVRQFTKVQITKTTREFWVLSKKSGQIDHYIQHVDRRIAISE